MNKETPIKRRTSANRSRLSGEAVVKVLELLKGSNSVELKVIVPQGHRGAIPALGFDPVEAEPRQTYFFDTPDLALNKAGLIVRARRSPKGKGDTVVKLRPIDPAAIEAELRHDEAFKIEVDVNPGGYVCSGSAKGRCTAQDVLDVSEGKTPLRSIFTRRQRDFFRAHAPEGLTMKDLVPLGPTFLSSAQAATEGIRPASGRRALALSGRLPHSRNLHEGHARRSLPAERSSGPSS